MQRDLIPVAVVVHLLIPLIAYLSMRNQHYDKDGETDVFRYAPGAAWFILIGGGLIMVVGAVIAWTAPRGQEVPPLMLYVSESAFLLMAIYGVYLVTLRIRVTDNEFTLSSLFGTRVVPFDQVKSATDRVTGKYRTLEVKTRAGKRVLYIGSTFMPDYAALADLIQWGAKSSGRSKE